MALHLKIISPERTEFDGEVDKVALPGVTGRFEILENHAPIISSLAGGKVVYGTADGEKDTDILAGIVSVKDNVVNLCVEMK